MICGMDTTGNITPTRFRFQTDEDMIETIHIQTVMSRDEKIMWESGKSSLSVQPLSAAGAELWRLGTT